MMSDAEMFRWAANVMAWERAKAKERGREIPRVRGITELRARVHHTLVNRDLASAKRGALAARMIEHAVRRAYRLGIE